MPGSCARRYGALVAGRKLDCPAPARAGAARSSPGASWIARLLRAPVRRARRRA
ncbi:AmiE [Mycobacterium tuberculosis]|nr:AmiE [Mycobacterium tuberculosis]BAQ04353.1 truncated carbon-nitrogen hydrolase [Mycobacterium tuberculosis str. Kurono]AOB41608.1 AmiE [Mycobacterium tuberculosis]AOE34801.1 AmiE [Mycobacterium tuberculosis]AOZ41531.1 hypothetical protein BTB1458_0521 [Mycobacterium tuberculosis]